MSVPLMSPQVLLFSEISPTSTLHSCSPLLPLTLQAFNVVAYFWRTLLYVCFSSCCQTNHPNPSYLKQHTFVSPQNCYFCRPGIPAQISWILALKVSSEAAFKVSFALIGLGSHLEGQLRKDPFPFSGDYWQHLVPCA